MLIHLQDEGDFNRIGLREVWFHDGFPMRIFRRSPNFCLDAEYFVILVCVSLLNLPLFLFNKQGLLSIDTILGKPLTLDASTAHLSCPSEAWLCVEIDMLKRLPQHIWLDCESVEGFWQDIIYEKLPAYCKHCKRLCHDISAYKFAHRDLTKKPLLKEKFLLKPAKIAH